MNNNLFIDFIEECSKEDISSWAKKRGYNLDLLKRLRIGKCTEEVMGRLKEKYGTNELQSNEFLTKKNGWKYLNRIIIPYSEDYFSARDQEGINQKYKNLFPKGIKKQVYFLFGENNADFYICEGETDTIRIKQEFPSAFVLSIGGSKSKNLFPTLIKKIEETKPSRVIFAFDNDEAGIEALHSFIQLIEESSKTFYVKDRIYKIIFNPEKKDIDDYFKDGGKKEDLKYEKIELKKPQANKSSIYYQEEFRLKIDNYLANSKIFYNKKPYFYDKSGIWWIWKDTRWQISDDIDMERELDKELGFYGQTISPGLRNGHLRACMWYGREQQPQESPKRWIQFKDKAFSLRSKNIYSCTKDYFFCNPIPYEIGESDSTPVMDKLFEQWVGKDYVKSLYQVIAYCCYRDYPIQTLVCLYGPGRNGKTCFQRLIGKFLGKDNICSTELDTLMDSRFESFKLYKKLAAFMGETNFGVLDKSSMLKKLTGSDMIGFEKKGKDPFNEYSYAKLIISSNSLPSSNDTSEGFYRRWFIIDFPNQFNEGKDVLEEIPEQEYSNLARKCMNLLPELLSLGHFDKQGSTEERKTKYIMSSNPLPIFLELCCEKSSEYYVSYNELYTAYVQFLNKHKKRKVKTKEFKSALEDEGFFAEKTSKSDGFNESGYNKYKILYWIDGLRLKDKWQDLINFTHFAHFTEIYISKKQAIYRSTECGQKHQIEQKTLQEEKVEDNTNILKFDKNFIIYRKCSKVECNETECNEDVDRKTYCQKHWEEFANK